MGENTRIQWANHTFNPWRGCTKVAAGCAHCYAEAQSKRNPKTLGIWGPNGSRVVASEAMWREPVKWERYAEQWRFTYDNLDEIARRGHEPPERPRVFCASLADVFEDWRGCVSSSDGRFFTKPYLDSEAQPENWMLDWEKPSESRDPQGWRDVTLDDVRARLFGLIDSTPNLDWLLLTKRPENIRRMWPSVGFPDSGVPGTLGRRLRADNIWLGTSIACQEDADRNIPELLKCRGVAAKLFLSIEPLVGPVDLTRLDNGGGERYDALRGEVRTVGGNKFRASDADPIDWVIVGGESGPNARPCDVAWIRSIVQQCQSVGVPVFVKQLGAKSFRTVYGGPAIMYGQPTHRIAHQFDNKLSDPKGGDPSEWPEDLRVREVPA